MPHPHCVTPLQYAVLAARALRRYSPRGSAVQRRPARSARSVWPPRRRPTMMAPAKRDPETALGRYESAGPSLALLFRGAGKTRVEEDHGDALSALTGILKRHFGDMRTGRTAVWLRAPLSLDGAGRAARIRTADRWPGGPTRSASALTDRPTGSGPCHQDDGRSASLG